VILAVMVLLATRYPPLARFDRDVPDAEPDDLVGLAALRQRGTNPPDAADPGADAGPASPAARA
jgi:hypothetical protein